LTGADQFPESLTLETVEKSVEDDVKRASNDALLRPREVAELFGVRVSTVTRWAKVGRLPVAVSTPGGHRRYRRADALSLRDGINDGVDPLREEMESDAVRLYQQGWNIRQVAEKFDCSYGVMRRILMERTSLRSRGGYEAPPERTQQVTQFMREYIESGHWRPYSRIPPPDELANKLRVPSRVVTHATAALQRQGYLWSLQHKGNYVRPAKDRQRETE
jgi:excisionase family DNA binding protein